MISTNIIFFFINHPISIGLTLIIQTIIVRIITGIKIKTFWMSYVLTITILRGILVLFIYIARVASNEKFKKSIKIIIYLITSILITILFLFLRKKIIIKNNYLRIEIRTFKIRELIFLNKIFNNNNIFITIIIVIYLLTTIIVSTHLVNISEGPIRLKI